MTTQRHEYPKLDAIHDGEDDRLRLYHGAADTSVALATCSVVDLRLWLNGHEAQPVTRTKLELNRQRERSTVSTLRRVIDGLIP